ncbi:hypothetical protein D8M15_07600, partial [Micrococcus sp. HSID17228]
DRIFFCPPAPSYTSPGDAPLSLPDALPFWRRRPWPAQLVSLGRLPLQVPLIRAAGRVARS